MRALPLLLFTPRWGGPPPPWPPDWLAAKRTAPTAKEDCTIEYGSSSRTYTKLNTCLGKCRSKYNLCRDRHLALQEEKDLGIERNPDSAAPPPPQEPTRVSSGETAPPEEKAPAESTSEPAVRRGVYRASEPEPEPGPAPEPAPVASSKPEPEPEPEPEPTKAPEPTKVAEPTKPEPKPAPVAASKPEPTPKPAATAAAETDPLLDDEPPPPPPKPKPLPTRPALPPEPKNDISEWDPNGD